MSGRLTRKRYSSRKTPLIVTAGFLVLVFWAMLAAASARSLAATDTPCSGDALVTASIGEPSNLIPFFASDSASAEISRLIFNGLLKYDKNLNLTGDLAETYEIKDGGLKILFHLRKNARWQDGRPFTASDVEFTLKKLKDPDLPTPYGADFEKVSGLKILDDYTLEVSYKEPFAPALASWTMGIVPKHLLLNENLMTAAFARHPVGTGPFVLKKWESGERLELVPNRDYFEGAPFLGRVVYRIIPDQATMFLELEMENVDEMALTPLQYRKQTGNHFFETHYVKFRTPSFGYTYLGYNLTSPLFADKRVRQALGLAINKQEIVDVTLLGMGRVATGPFLPDSWAYNPAVKPARFDPAAAQKLLAEAGWSDHDGDGILDKDGRKFAFTVITNQGSRERKMACEMIQKRLRDIGIKLNIQVIEWSAFLRDFVDRKKFDAVLLGWQLSPEPDIYDIFHSSKTKAGEFNFISYHNEEVDRLLEEGRRTFDQNERARVYHRLHEILSEEEPYTFLSVPDALILLHKRFRGVKLAAAGISYNLIRWYVPENEQRYKLRAAA